MIRALILATGVAFLLTSAVASYLRDEPTLDEYCAADPIACIILFEEIEPTEPTPAPREVMV